MGSYTANPAGLIDRTIGNLRRAWQGFGSTRSEMRLEPDLPDADLDLLRDRLHECLDGRGGEVSARARAAALGEAYIDLNDTGKRRFLKLVVSEFGVDHGAIVKKARELEEPNNVEDELAIEASLRDLLRPSWLTLLQQFNSLPSGVKFLVDMRADLLRLANGDTYLEYLDADMHRLLGSWFDIGFLELRQITWDAPAALLERLIEHEAVHEIKSWSDLKNRLAPDRRCYAFFHPSMPNEPLIFVQVALVRELSDNVQVLLDESAPLVDEQDATTAIFYSITNTQEGLKGVSFGDFLIKRVVNDLSRDLPGIRTFSTLSPIPGFMRFFHQHLVSEEKILTDAERTLVSELHGSASLTDLLESGEWTRHEELASALEAPLKRWCARYLVEEEYRGRARDPVAHFHLTNGSRLERINWLGDRSDKGLRDSAGMMVNYLYVIKDIESNHEAYRESGARTISSSVQALLKQL